MRVLAFIGALVLLFAAIAFGAGGQATPHSSSSGGSDRCYRKNCSVISLVADSGITTPYVNASGATFAGAVSAYLGAADGVESALWLGLNPATPPSTTNLTIFRDPSNGTVAYSAGSDQYFYLNMSTVTASVSTAGTIRSYATSGNNAFQIGTDGARLRTGTHASSYFSSVSGVGAILTPAALVISRATGTTAVDIVAGARICLRSGGDNGATCFGNSFMSADATGNLNYSGGAVTSTAGFKPGFQTLSTCNSTLEGTIQADALSGVATGNRTRLCNCSSSGSSAWAWQNIITGTVGTSTTCPN